MLPRVQAVKGMLGQRGRGAIHAAHSNPRGVDGKLRAAMKSIR